MNKLRLLLLAALLAAGTLFFGWWTVPVIAAVYALVRRKATAPREAMLAALLAWLLLFSRVMSQPAFATLLDRLGQLFSMPGLFVFALSFGLAVVLAWSAARAVTGVVSRASAQGHR